MNLFPGRVLGAELASIFAVFTSQAWNMAFSFYQSLRTVPLDLDEASRAFRFSSWQRFWRLEAPFAVPGLAEHDDEHVGRLVLRRRLGGDQRRRRTDRAAGHGFYVALAIARQDLGAIGWALLAMTVVIILYDQLMFRPLVVWADHFRSEQAAAQTLPHSWFLTVLRRARFLRMLSRPLGFGMQWALRAPLLNKLTPTPPLVEATTRSRVIDALWYAGVILAAVLAAAVIVRFIASELNWSDVLTVARLGFYTLLRVAVLIALASLVWVPVGVMIGLRPKLAEAVQPLAQFLAAFPANLLFPFAVIMVVRYSSQPEYLAEHPDDPRHAMVYSVQCDRRRLRLPDGFSRSRRQFPYPRLEMVAQRDPARHFSLLRDRPSPPPAARGTPASSPSWSLGATRI